MADRQVCSHERTRIIIDLDPEAGLQVGVWRFVGWVVSRKADDQDWYLPSSGPSTPEARA